MINGRQIFCSLTVLALAVVAFPLVTATQSYSDNFDTVTAPSAPSAAWYTFTTAGSGDFRTSNAFHTSGANSFLFKSQSSGNSRADFAMTPVGGDFCSEDAAHPPTASHIRFTFRFGSALDGNAAHYEDFGAFRSPGVGTDASYVRVYGNGAVKASGVTSLVGLTVTNGVWYNVTISMTCSLNLVNVYFSNEDIGATYDGAGAQTSMTTFQVGLGDGVVDFPTLYIDGLSVDNINNPPPTSISSDATSSTFTNLNGFSVDRTGSLVIVRTDAGDQVRTLSSVDLSTQASEDTDCLRDDNVLSQMTPSGPLILYTDCDPSHNPDTFKLRTSAFQTTDLTGCGTGCADIDSNDFVSNADDDQTQFKQVQQFPIDFNDNHGIPLSGGTLWKTAWAWSGQGSRAGEVGIATYTNCQGPVGCLNYGELARVTFGGTSSAVADDICTANDGSGFWMASADSTAPGKAYPVTWTNVSVHSGSYYALRAVIGSAATFPVSGPIGVACGHSLVAFVTSSQVSVWMRSGGGSPLWTASCTCEGRGVALSDLRSDGKQFVSWLDGNVGYIAYAGNGTKVGSVAYTHSGFTQTTLQENAQSIYIASNNVVKRYPINAVTGVVSSNGTTITVAPVASGIFANSGAMIGASLGVGAFGGNLFLGVICIGICAVSVGGAMRSVLGGIIGGILGFILSWAFGFFSTAVVFSMVVLGLLAFFFASRRGSAAE